MVHCRRGDRVTCLIAVDERSLLCSVMPATQPVPAAPCCMPQLLTVRQCTCLLTPSCLLHE